MVVSIRLHAESLNSRYGFEDGDELSSLYGQFTPHTAPAGWVPSDFEHIVLYHLVHEHLLPLLSDKPGIVFIHTHHNPVRFTDCPNHQTYSSPVFVDVGEDEIKQAAEWVAGEWADGRSGVPVSE